MNEICRICLDSDNQNDLISPCLCSGTQRYVHQECLNKWRFQDLNSNNYKKCHECKTNFKFKIKKDKKFYFHIFHEIIIKNFFIMSLWIISFNCLIGYLIELIYFQYYESNITYNFYFFGVLINIILMIIYLFFLNLYLKITNRPRIFKFDSRFIHLSSLIFLLIFNLLFFFISWILLIMLNLPISYLFYNCIMQVQFDKYVHQEIVFNNPIHYIDNIENIENTENKENIENIEDIV